MKDFTNIASDYFHLLKEEPYTQREALIWLIENASHNGKLEYSIRSLSRRWQWSEATTRRFISKLADNALIEVQSDARGSSITICNYLDFYNSNNINETNNDAINGAAKVKSPKIIKNNAEFDAANDAALFQENKDIHPQGNVPHAASYGEAQLLTLSQKKEKNQKKKNLQKEKNTPYRGLKKEKVRAEIAGLDGGASEAIRKKMVHFQEVTVDLIEAWARDNLPSIPNLSWELGKFKDYWQSTRKKPPKDGLAAFRNWLRNAYEYKQQKEELNGKYHKKQQTSGLQNFLIAGANLAAKYERDRLDRNNAGPQ
jgi:hypothetical protein